MSMEDIKKMIDAALPPQQNAETQSENEMSVSGESFPECVARLSALSPEQYDRVRKQEADKRGMRLSTLDQEVDKARKGQTIEPEKGKMFPDVAPWPDPVDANALFNEMFQSVKRFIICSQETALATVLWCAFTWLIDDVQVAPLAVITAPEKRCGKSQLLTFIGKLSRRPLVSSNISPAAVYRVIEAQQPTLLIDEADSFLKDNEELRGVINSGHTRQSAYVIRTVGDDFEPKQFSTWSAKALSGIGPLTDTLMDRAIVLPLRRKLPSESVEKLRHAEPDYFETLARKLSRFAVDAAPSIRHARPQLPEALHDRAQDNWEPLFAIAEHVGGEWPELARQAAIKISGAEEQSLSFSTELLMDIREAFAAKGVARLSSQEMLSFLTHDDAKPWATYNRGKPMTPHQLAKKLKEYGIKSNSVRVGTATPKGYKKEDFEDIFTRYLAPLDAPTVLSATPPQFPQTPFSPSNYFVADN